VGWRFISGQGRTLSDFAYGGYLAVRAAHQREGMAPPSSKTREQMGSRSMLVLLSTPKVVAYYPKMGFTRHEAPGFCAPTSRGQFPPLTVSH